MIGTRRALAVCALLAASTSALAQDDTALALTLFESGKTLADAQNYAEACPKFLSSYKLVPKLGTLLNLADCYEKSGKTASAWARFTEAVGRAERGNQPDRAAFAKEHAEALAPSLSTLTIGVKDVAPGLSVTSDGTPITSSTFGMPVPIDPGEHVITATAPKKKPWSTTVTIGKSAVQRVDIPELESAPEPPPGTPGQGGPPCEEGDASCGRPFATKTLFIQARVGGAFSVGGFLADPGPGYAGAQYRLGGGFEAGVSLSIGLQKKFPAGSSGGYSSIVVEPLLGWFGGATVGKSPSTNETKATGDFIFRVGATVAYQFFWLQALAPFSDHQRGIGFLIGYRPGVQYTWAKGGFRGEEQLGFMHGPVIQAVFPTYYPRSAKLERGFFELAFLHTPETSGYFLVIGGGATFP
jgi:hypothetical protein